MDTKQPYQPPTLEAREQLAEITEGLLLQISGAPARPPI